MNERPNVEMKRASLFLLFAVMLSACGTGGDLPTEDPTTTAPADLISDAPEPAAEPEGEATVTEAEPGTEAEPVTDLDGGSPGVEAVTTQDETTEETRDRDAPSSDDPAPTSDLPAPTLEHPKYPNTEPSVPPPRD